MSHEKSNTPNINTEIVNDMAAISISLDQVSNQLSIHEHPVSRPPSFSQSEFEMIVRRQRSKHPLGLKIVDAPSRYPNLDNKWEFAGWGTMSYLNLSDEQQVIANTQVSQKPSTMGKFRATSIAGSSMTSSVFYAFPALVAVSSIFSPLSLLVACFIIFLWKPVFLELGSAIRLNGGNYAYLLQVSGKTLGLIAAAATMLDSVATSTVSAATASSYLQGEIHNLPISNSTMTIILLSILTLMCLLNLRASSTLALCFFLFHLLTMTILMTASIVSWAREGSSMLKLNWDLRPRGASNVAKSIFNGICVGFLMITGFETTPTYIEMIHPNDYDGVLRNVLLCTLILSAPLLLMIYAVLPAETILSTNILSILAEKVAGRWLRIIVVADCVLVLSGGVLAGIYSCCALIEKLSGDHVVSRQFLKALPVTGSPYIAIFCCLILNILLYASSAFSLETISGVFTVSFLFVLLLFVVSDLLLKFNRDRLPRTYRTSILTVIITLTLGLTLLVGNIVQSPKILGLYAIYFLVTLLPLILMRAKAQTARVILWLYDQLGLHSYRLTAGWDAKIVRNIKLWCKYPICVWVRRDDIHNLVDIILYIRSNEITARIIFIHAYQQIDDIPTELAPNIKILDEAFPTTTIDLTFVQGSFSPQLVGAVSIALDIPRSRMFMACPGRDHGWELADYQGVRVVKF